MRPPARRSGALTLDRTGSSRAILNEGGTNIFERFRFRDVHPAYVDPARNRLQNYQTSGYTLLWEVFDDPMGIVGGMWNQYVQAAAVLTTTPSSRSTRR